MVQKQAQQIRKNWQKQLKYKDTKTIISSFSFQKTLKGNCLFKNYLPLHLQNKKKRKEKKKMFCIILEYNFVPFKEVGGVGSDDGAG